MQRFHSSISQNPIAISSTFRIWTCWFFGYSSERLHCSKHTDAKKHHRARTNNSTTTLTHTERPNLDTKNDRNKNAENHRKILRTYAKGRTKRVSKPTNLISNHMHHALHAKFASCIRLFCASKLPSIRSCTELPSRWKVIMPPWRKLWKFEIFLNTSTTDSYHSYHVYLKSYLANSSSSHPVVKSIEGPYI